MFRAPPYQIALLGAPGSGKAKVLAALKRLDWGFLGGLHVIPQQAEGLKRLDQAIGMHASYREDLWVFFRILERERLLQEKGQNFVTVGAALEPFAHSLTNLQTLELGLPTDDAQQEIILRTQAATTLGCLFYDNFIYQFMFYLPHTGGDDYSKRIDMVQRSVLDDCGLGLQEITGPPTEQAQAIYDTVKEYYDSGSLPIG